MPRALYYGPSWQRLEAELRQVAPDLEVALLQADGQLVCNGLAISCEDFRPEWFWVHGELMGSRERTSDYFRLMQQCESASWLHTINTGLDVLPYQPLLEKGMSITNNHSQAPAIAEYVLGQVMAHFQQHEQLQRQQGEAKWKYTRFRELAGQRWLIIGFGHIGQEVAKRAKVFGIHVDAVRRSSSNEGLADRVLSLDSMTPALAEADVVVLTCTANDETRNLVDARFLQHMKEGSVLVNVARGELVDETALLEALDSGKPSRAILDVFRQEPLPVDSKFWQHPSVVITPHCSNAGSGMLARSDALFIENLRRRVQGETLLNLVSLRDI